MDVSAVLPVTPPSPHPEGERWASLGVPMAWAKRATIPERIDPVEIPY